ncbi:hypothetical protein, partial [Methanogenium cariaci]|uniref:hypothetical protein n=1 Tax=Methanogenium cariaci TaxID=2197 RepID=UPI001C485BC6
FLASADMNQMNNNAIQVNLDDGLLSAILSVIDLKYYLIAQSSVPMEALNTLPATNFAYDENSDQYFQLYVPEEKEHLWIDLNWAGRDVAYKLTVFSPRMQLWDRLRILLTEGWISEYIWTSLLQST